MSKQLEEVRQFCSDWICKYFGKQYDNTPWMDKWELYKTYAEIHSCEEQLMMNIVSYLKRQATRKYNI